MNHPTLDRDVAEAIYKLLGDTYETAAWHETPDDRDPHRPHERIPLPSFSETIRLLPKIGERKGWYGRTGEDALMIWNIVSDCAHRYVAAPSPDQGMKEVSNYLRKIL